MSDVRDGAPWSVSLPETIVETFMYSGFIRDLKQRGRRRTTTTSLTIGFMSKTTALHVHHAFKYISLTSTARLRRETSQCDVLWRTRTYYDKFSLLYLNMDKALNYEFNSRKSRLHLTIKFERTQIQFFVSDVFITVFVVFA